jgi:HD-like signal output (HDOD) protein
VADSSDDARRREARIKRRTTRLDNLFSFTPDATEIGKEALFTRGEAEQRASTLLAPLPALPAIVLEASKPAGPGTSCLETAIEEDSDLASLTLGLASASFFRRDGDVPSNMMQLIDRVGTAAFRNMTLIAFFRGLFADPLPWYGCERQGLWRHLLATAVAAWKIGEAVGFHPIAREHAFLAAILHDIGKPTVQGLLSADAPAPQVASMGGELTVLEAERRTVNMTHPELVPLILDIWGVEHDVFAVAEHHHAPQRAGSKAVQASIVQLADLIANRAGIGLAGPYGFSAPPIERVAAKLNVAEPLCVNLIDSLGWTVAEIAAEIEDM